MKKPLILMYTNVYETTAGQGLAYLKFFSQFGDVLLVTSEMDLTRMIALGDVLALPGGMDLNSDTYGSRPGFDMRYINAHFEYLDKYLLMPWIETGKPIVGICRGMQALNVACGGTLHRHIWGHVQEDERYETSEKMFTMFTDDKGKNIHQVVDINSFHHQSVDILAPGFQILGWSEYSYRDPARKKAKFKGAKWEETMSKGYKQMFARPMVPEIMAHTDRPYIAFQYHPEELNCDLAISLITETLANYDNQKATEEKEEVVAGHHA